MNSGEVVYTYTKSPHGEILLARNELGLTRINFQRGPAPHTQDPSWHRDDDALQEAIDQLQEYFSGARQVFEIPLAPLGTDFQQSVWEALQRIPFGATTTYADIAQQIGQPAAIRAVGAANGSNPLPIVVPCHRVIGSDGQLTGYAGGLPIKRALLRHEGVLGAEQLEMTL